MEKQHWQRQMSDPAVTDFTLFEKRSDQPHLSPCWITWIINVFCDLWPPRSNQFILESKFEEIPSRWYSTLCSREWNGQTVDVFIWWNPSSRQPPPDYSQDCLPLGPPCCWLRVQHRTSGGKRCQEFPAVAPKSWRRAPRTSPANWETGDVFINSMSF